MSTPSDATPVPVGYKQVAIGFSGTTEVVPGAIQFAVDYILSLGGFARAISLRHQRSYSARASTSWTELRDSAATYVFRAAHAKKALGGEKLILGESVGGLVAFSAALRCAGIYDDEEADWRASLRRALQTSSAWNLVRKVLRRGTPATTPRDDSESVRSESDAKLPPTTSETDSSEKSEPRGPLVDTVVLFNPAIRVRLWLRPFYVLALLLILIGLFLPVLGIFIRRIPVYRVSSDLEEERARWMPLGMVAVIWAAQRDVALACKRFRSRGKRLPFRLVCIVGTSDALCSAEATADWAKSLGGEVIPLGFEKHSFEIGSLEDPADSLFGQAFSGIFESDA